MENITSKELHERTGQLLDKVESGQKFQVIRNGQAAAWLVPSGEKVDPSWDEILADVRTARAAAKKSGKKPQANPVLEERRRRDLMVLKDHAHLR